MNATGTWKVKLATPAGPQEMALHITGQPGQGERFTGRVDGAMGGIDVTGEVRGNALSWTMSVVKPLPIKVKFDVVIDGDKLSGTAKAGFFPKATLTGERVSAKATAAAAAAVPDVVTESSVDPQFKEPYIEVDEQRTDPAPHRYVRGGFKGTDARFSFYFPPKARYEGRFFHNTYPLAMTSDVGPFPIAFDVATGNLGFTFDFGAYYVQTNLGGADRAPPADASIGAYRVNAAAAKFSRKVAAQMYGEHRAYGYLFGGSGGSYQVVGSAENTVGVWDGFVPFVLATPNAIPSMFTVRMHALRVLRKRDKLAGIADAIGPGGSGDPLADLNEEERGAYLEATRMGFPPRGWWNHDTLGGGYFSKVAGIVPMIDPGYLEDFWTKPGYLGHDDPSLRAERLGFDTKVVRVIDGFLTQVELESVPDRDFADVHVVLPDGRSAPIAEIDGRIVTFSISADPRVVKAVRAGDRVRLDNSWALALQTYHRHQVPAADMQGWDQFRDAAGKPIHPQRELLIGPVGAANTAGSIPNGRISGKMLLLECLMDIDALPWQADWYRAQVMQQLGDRAGDQFALWFIDHAQHDDPQTTRAHAHTVSFSGALQQALRDVSAWVEKGAKPSSTRFAVKDAQVSLPTSAGERGGVQPVVDLRANGGVRANLAIGEPVTFTATIEVPPGAGKIVAAEWDFEGIGTYPVPARIDPAERLSLSATHAFAQPGTYFPVLRVTSQRQGDAKTAYGRVQNLGRVRVVAA